MDEMRQPQSSAFSDVSARWLAGAAAVALLAAGLCAWLTLCLLYWQGSWQLLYHPKAAITRTPASIGLPYETERFAATETGETRLTGWWVPAEGARFTVLYLHGADGNLSDTVDAIAALHRVGLAVFAIDYRGYGQSAAARPSEALLREDAESALRWLTESRKTSLPEILLFGSGLGANLAAEVGAAHGALAGVVLDEPLADAMTAVFGDARSRLVPARWLVRDRYDLNAAASVLRMPSLWIFAQSAQGKPASFTAAYETAQAKKAAVWLNAPVMADPHFGESFERWLDEL
jgi:uncharacterized protein